MLAGMATSPRPKGSGSALNRPKGSGRWELRVNLAPDPVTGERRVARETFHGSKPGTDRDGTPTIPKDVQRALAALVARTEPERATGDGITVEKLLRDWMIRVEKDRSPTTTAEYWRVLDALWIPQLGGVVLRDLRPRHIQAVLDAEHGRPDERDAAGRRARASRLAKLRKQAAAARAAGDAERLARLEAQTAKLAELVAIDDASPPKTVSAAAVNRSLAPLRRALNEAVQLELIERSPADARLVKPRDAKRRRDEPTEAEMAAILQAAIKMDPGLGTLLRVAAATGVRRGELCGYRWRDVDYDAGTIAVVKNVVIVRNRRRPEGDVARRARKVLVKDTKTHQQRGLDIDAGTATLLRMHHEIVQAVAEREGVKLHRDAFVFSRSIDGSQPLLPDWVTKAFKKAAEAAGVPAHLHQMRHMSVQAQLDAGIPLAIVSQRAGHDRQSTTTDIYNRRTRTRSPEAAAVLGRFLDGVQELPPGG
jgi:integrase